MLRISHQSFTFRLTFPLLLAAFPEAGVLNVKNQSSVVYFSFDVPPFCLQLSQKVGVLNVKNQSSVVYFSFLLAAFPEGGGVEC